MTNADLCGGQTVLGIIGGGQLGRMTALAAARLGVRTHIFTPETDSPASQVAEKTIVAAYDDTAALKDFASGVDVITLEFENIPAPTMEFLSGLRTVRPNARALELSQDRRHEKDYFRSLGVATPRWLPILNAGELVQAMEFLNGPAILKTARFGYDGKGQARVRPDSDLEAAWNSLGGVPCVLEEFVPFESEISVVVARKANGETAAFNPAMNVHRDGILRTSTFPAPEMDVALIEQAQDITRTIAGAMDLVGLLAVEFFKTADGRLLANEMAPRPHNSAHWTMDACHTDQFEQFVRAVLDLPLGDPSAYRHMRMTNLIGDDINAVPGYLANPQARIHLYGKTECRPGRKMGHVNEPLPRTLAE
ncbi:5-(carboxyamino)imidazole ribonucleotide synthase [Phaeovibrio sulfidiphilus]|uniref:N5-carboxyaminoimidazole ribonucleotide synthase n=1 Tax=Phaeovibrio sulfidiphilus TaxID=1220600 RepID=A0A8J6YLA0_9PROT|nr:5-(carboxyamino)imidazole ribonucleotide synthase [Phaeovibrio sulfidiphilus]MBE1236455.1 5-(carboxyamino)imidazole ribonucleotide synthase [Phaeovibrio sulfidiphilus]